MSMKRRRNGFIYSMCWLRIIEKMVTRRAVYTLKLDRGRKKNIGLLVYDMEVAIFLLKYWIRFLLSVIM